MKDYLFSLVGQSKTLTLEEILLRIGVSMVVAGVIYLSYWVTHAGTIYSKKFNVSLVMMTVLTTTVMTVIGNNIALSLGMVGALSIVRYRTAVKDTRDTAYIFWTIIGGICCGVGDYLVVAVGSAAVFVLLLFFGRIRSDSRRLLIIRGARSKERAIEGKIFECFNTRVNLRVKNTTPATVEFIYELTGRQVEKAVNSGLLITDMLYDLGEIEYVNLVSQNDEISG